MFKSAKARVKRKGVRGSLAIRVLLVCIVAFALPLLIYLFFLFHISFNERMRDLVVRLKDLGRSRAQLLTDLNEANMRTVDVIQELMITEKAFPSEPGGLNQLTNILTSVADGGRFSSIFYISLVGDQQSQIIAASNTELVGQDFSSYHYLETVKVEGKTSFLAFGSSSFDKYFYDAKLIYDSQSLTPVGILTLSTGVDDLIERLVAREDTTYSVNFSLVTKDRIIFASGDPSLTLRTLAPVSLERKKQLEQTSRFDATKLRSTQIEVSGLEGVQGAVSLEWKDHSSIGIEMPIRGTQLSLLLTANEEEVFGEQRSRLMHVIGYFVLIFLVGGGIAFWITQRLSRPLRQLVSVMTRVSKGDLTARFESERLGLEVNSLGAIFNETIVSLRNQMAKAEKERVQKEFLRQELKIGRDIQMRILPQVMPSFPGVQLAARYIPAKQVGGDFYDIYVKKSVQGGEDDLVLTVADASGKGVSACLYSLGLRSMLRSAAVAWDDVSAIMKQANNLFCQDTGDTGMFVTALTAIYHPGTHLLTYTSCGHTPGIVLRQNGEVVMMSSSATAVGVLIFDELEEQSVKVGSGDLVLLYTDGITEMHNEKNQLFGDDRLLEFIKEHGDQNLDAIVDSLVEEVTAFRGGAAQYDDITVLIMRID